MPRTDSIPGSNSTFAILLALHTRVLFLGLGLDGGGGLDGVVLLDVGSRSGDRAPGFAACEGETHRDKDAE